MPLLQVSFCLRQAWVCAFCSVFRANGSVIFKKIGFYRAIFQIQSAHTLSRRVHVAGHGVPQCVTWAARALQLQLVNSCVQEENA